METLYWSCLSSVSSSPSELARAPNKMVLSHWVTTSASFWPGGLRSWWSDQSCIGRIKAIFEWTSWSPLAHSSISGRWALISPSHRRSLDHSDSSWLLFVSSNREGPPVDHRFQGRWWDIWIQSRLICSALRWTNALVCSHIIWNTPCKVPSSSACLIVVHRVCSVCALFLGDRHHFGFVYTTLHSLVQLISSKRRVRCFCLSWDASFWRFTGTSPHIPALVTEILVQNGFLSSHCSLGRAPVWPNMCSILWSDLPHQMKTSYFSFDWDCLQDSLLASLERIS